MTRRQPQGHALSVRTCQLDTSPQHCIAIVTIMRMMVMMVMMMMMVMDSDDDDDSVRIFEKVFQQLFRAFVQVAECLSTE